MQNMIKVVNRMYSIIIIFFFFINNLYNNYEKFSVFKEKNSKKVDLI